MQKPRIPPHPTTKQEILFLRRMGFPAQKKMNIASKQLLKLLLEETGEVMPTARAYILEMLGNTKTNKSFSI